MASQNGTAATILTSPGLFGGGLSSAGTGNSAGGFESAGADAFQYEYTAINATPAVFTSANLVSAQGLPAVGTPVTLGWNSVPVSYTATSASPAVFTSADLVALGLEDEANLLQQGIGVILLGTPPGGFTASVLNTANPYNGVTASITQYFVIAGGLNTSTGVFELSTTQGGSASNSTSAISTLSSASQLMVYGGVPAGFSPFTTYYVAASPAPSGNTFSLVVKSDGTGTAIASTSIGAGILQLQVQNQVDYQVAIGASTAYQGIRLGGFRVGIQPGQAVASASSMSLDESPQMAWQNVAGATCQSGNANTVTGATTAADTYPGWGQAGGYSTTGAAGQFVDEAKAPVMHTNETNGKLETSAERKARLTSELNSLKEKGSPTAKEVERKAVVESALKELK